MSVTQKQGVYDAVTAHLNESGVAFEEGNQVKLDKDARATVIGMLCAATTAGEIEVKSDKAQADLKTYWNGCLSNWLRKDTRLNGGDKYETKNPGSRAGAGDARLRELKKLAKIVTAEADVQAVNDAIEARTAELQAEKAKDVQIDVDSLPEALRGLVG